MLIAYGANTIFTTLITLFAVIRLKLFPPSEKWGRASLQTFRELFDYGRQIFLLSVGLQLVNASQVIIISRIMGLETAAIWSIATKPFLLAQQIVYRLLDY